MARMSSRSRSKISLPLMVVVVLTDKFGLQALGLGL
jgi:hypothetical protein